MGDARDTGSELVLRASSSSLTVRKPLSLAGLGGGLTRLLVVLPLAAARALPAALSVVVVAVAALLMVAAVPVLVVADAAVSPPRAAANVVQMALKVGLSRLSCCQQDSSSL